MFNIHLSYWEVFFLLLLLNVCCDCSIRLQGHISNPLYWLTLNKQCHLFTTNGKIGRVCSAEIKLIDINQLLKHFIVISIFYELEFNITFFSELPLAVRY